VERERQQMLMLLPPLVALMVALGRGGKVGNLGTLPFREGWWFGAGLALQLVIYIPGLQNPSLVLRIGPLVYLGSICLLLTGMGRNWELGTGMRIAALGLSLNALAIGSNGAHMPTNIQAMVRVAGTERVRTLIADKTYSNVQPANRQSCLLALTDIIPIPLPPGHGNVYSAGDMLLWGGGAWLVYGGTLGTQHPARKKRRGIAKYPLEDTTSGVTRADMMGSPEAAAMREAGT